MDRPAVVVAPAYGLAVVGTSMILEGQVVGAAVAGYAFVDFCTVSAVEQLARDSGIPFSQVWGIARTTVPVPARRLAVHGELLQVLGDAILRENLRTRQYEETATQLRAAIDAKDEFLAVVSHELRTPLTPILLWARMLRRDMDPARIEQAGDVIERNARLQARLVEDLLEATRAARQQIALHLAVHDLDAEVGTAVASVLESARERGIELRLEQAGQQLPVRADRDRLHQILQNVLSNALKFTPRGGEVAVRIRKDGGTATVAVGDTGQGVSPEFQPFVFDMFRRENEAQQTGDAGLGIGLALVKRLVELHKGDVTLSSKGVGLGTLVVIRLPLVDGVSELPAAGDARSPRELAGLRVLVVEDRTDVREAIMSLLNDLGAEVEGASDGVEALEVTGRHHPALVLCDLHMPRMGGVEFLGKLRGDTSGQAPPVIAMTGIDSETETVTTHSAGFSGHLRKPFEEDALLAAIRTAIAP